MSLPTRMAIDERTGRRYYLDQPQAIRDDDALVFILSLHGGGSSGAFQRLYFPAYQYCDALRLVVAAPTAATVDPYRHWVGDADDEHLRNIVDQVLARYGHERIAAFWLAGHSHGGITCNRLLRDEFFQQRVDGWLSLSGGRIGGIEVVDNFFPPGRPAASSGTVASSTRPTGGRRARIGTATAPECDLSFIFAVGEHEMVSLPRSSPWAERCGAGARVERALVVDERPGFVHDLMREGMSTPGWGRVARPGSARVLEYPNARDGRVIADVVRLDKGHTEGLEPNVTRAIVDLMVSAPGAKARRHRERSRESRGTMTKAPT